MATYKPEQRGRARTKQAREIAKRAARQAKERATAEKGDKPSPAQVIKEALRRR